MIYRTLVSFANWFAAKFNTGVTIFDEIASWFEPTEEDEADIRADLRRTKSRESNASPWFPDEMQN